MSHHQSRTALQHSRYVAEAQRAGCPLDQLDRFIRAGVVLQPRQLAASAAARLCDQPGGPSAIGYGGARGGGKSHWLLAQMGADDCQRIPELKCLLLRKVGKSNLEHFEDLRQRLFRSLPHNFNASRGILTFENGSRIVAKHYQHEKEIDAFLGLEYDVIGIEEATTLTARKYNDLVTCLRTSKTNWRPRLYSTTNPGGIGHEWYRQTFIVPHERNTESDTRFIPARVDDNVFTNPEYKSILASRSGWQKEAWYHGRWDIAAGQFFHTFRPEHHVIDNFNLWRGIEWFAAMDYGYTHYTVVLLACLDDQDNLVIIDEHAERQWAPQRHVQAIQDMFHRHHVFISRRDPYLLHPSLRPPGSLPFVPHRLLSRFIAGNDLFGTQYDGSNIASHFSGLGIHISPANTNRTQGWAEILRRLGDPDAGFKPSLFIHKRCTRLLDCLPFLQHDPAHPADVLKTNPTDEGLGGDDAADALRYLVATPSRKIIQRKLTGL